MKNNLKTNNYNKQNSVVTDLSNEQEYTIYDYFKSPSISNEERIPPKNSISELVYHNKIEELKKHIKKQNKCLDNRDSVGQTASWTPLYWGVKYKRFECVELLLANGASLNIVINDLEECCGTVLDLAILRGDCQMENLLRQFVEKEEINLNVTFKAIRTKLRGKAPSFNFNSYSNKSK